MEDMRQKKAGVQRDDVAELTQRFVIPPGEMKAEPEVRARERRERIELGRATELGDRFVVPSTHRENVAVSLVRERIAGVEGDGPAKAALRRGAIHMIDGLECREGTMRFGQRRIDLDRPARGGQTLRHRLVRR